jgi:ElaB protein
MTTKAEPKIDSTADELKALVRDAEALLSEGGDEANEKIAELRNRLRAAVQDGRKTLDRVKVTAREQAEHCDEYVRSHPYHAAGIAAGVGAVIALLVSRRVS